LPFQTVKYSANASIGRRTYDETIKKCPMPGYFDHCPCSCGTDNINGCGTNGYVPVDYDIEAQSLKSALEIYQKTSGLNLAYSDDLVEGKMTDGVDGKNTTAQALKKILKDTGLTYMVTNQGTVVLKKNKMVVAQREAEKKRL
jgi:Secretin and TonB N terminus short domain.